MSPAQIVEWNAARVVEQVSDLVATRMETACKFVEETARGNLESIRSPDWGAAYRSQIVGRLLTSYVEKDGKSVLGRVGVRSASGKGGDSHGFYIELGSSTAPAHPWLRPALFNNQKDVLQLLEG